LSGLLNFKLISLCPGGVVVEV